jgi:holo-[acyl-carrier protein] synthase
MIVGTGIDIAEVPRIEASIARFGNRFLRRIFTEAEIGYCDSKANRVERYAARFAAKEAAMKAIGTGWNHGVSRLGAIRVALSLSHTKDYAIAQVILEN